MIILLHFHLFSVCKTSKSRYSGSIADIEVDKLSVLQKRQLELPIKHCGIGLGDLVATARAAYIASFIATFDFVNKFFPRDTILNSSSGKCFRNNITILNQSRDEEQRLDEEELISHSHEYFQLQRLINDVNKQLAVEHFMGDVARMEVGSEEDAKYKALILSVHHPISGAFLSAMPRPETTFTSDEFKVACWLRLLYPIPLINEYTIWDCKRKVPLGKFGEHVLWCGMEGTANYRHNALCGHLKYLMQLGLPKRVISEPRHFYLHTSAGDERRPDLVVYGLPKFGSGRRSMLKDVAVDVSVTYPLSQSALKAGSSITAMTAGRLAYHDKLRQYEGPSRERGVKFIPMIFETFGAMHENSERFLHHLVARASAYRGVRSSTLHTYWNRRISCTLQTINAQMILSKIGRLEDMEMARSCYGGENVVRICQNDPTLNHV